MSKYYSWLKYIWYRLIVGTCFFKNIPLTEEAEEILTQAVNDYVERIIDKAQEFASEEGHPELITEGNVDRASKEVS